MPIDIFGFSIGKASKEQEVEKNLKQESFVSPDEYDGAQQLNTGGFMGSYVDFSGGIQDENQFIQTYRSLSLYPEVDMAIEDIVNDSIIMGTDRKPVKVDLETTNLSENIKTKIYKEFDSVLKMFDFANKGYEIFRRWYVDGRVYYHIIIDKDNPRAGVKEVRAIDPTKIKKVRNVNKKPYVQGHVSVPLISNIEEFYIYIDNDKKSHQYTGASGVKISPDSIAYVHSGIVDTTTKKVVGYLQKAIRPVNMLRQIEDAVVIYRISRAPERRIFRIDVGNLPKVKAEQYLRDVMNRYRNKLVYDASSGEIRDGRNHLSMLEDFWLPIREGGRGTDVQTLPGGQNLGEIEDIKYFQKRLYRSLNVPVSRLTEESPGTVVGAGRSSEVTRDELKFTKFVQRLRKKFTGLFLEMLRTQLILKGIINDEDWQLMKERVNFNFIKDGHFSELKDAELLQNRIDTLDRMQSYIGTFYSKTYVQKYVLRMSDTDIARMKDEIKQESGEGDLNVPDGSDGVTRYPTLPPGSTQIDMTKTDDDDEEENGDTQQPPQDEPENEGEL